MTDLCSSWLAEEFTIMNPEVVSLPQAALEPLLQRLQYRPVCAFLFNDCDVPNVCEDQRLQPDPGQNEGNGGAGSPNGAGTQRCEEIRKQIKGLRY